MKKGTLSAIDRVFFSKNARFGSVVLARTLVPSKMEAVKSF